MLIVDCIVSACLVDTHGVLLDIAGIIACVLHAVLLYIVGILFICLTDTYTHRALLVHYFLLGSVLHGALLVYGFLLVFNHRVAGHIIGLMLASYRVSASRFA